MIFKVISKHVTDLLQLIPATMIICWNQFISSLPTLSALFAFVFVLLQISFLIWKWRKEINSNKDNS